MDRKKELKQQYQEIEIIAGVYQIKNNINGKVFIDSTRNLKTLNGVRFSLQNNMYVNKALQEEWNQYGKDVFSFEILEKLKKDESNPYWNEKEALNELKEKWLQQVQPFGERGYN